MPSKRGYSVHVRRVWKTYEIGLNWGELVLQGGVEKFFLFIENWISFIQKYMKKPKHVSIETQKMHLQAQNCKNN